MNIDIEKLAIDCEVSDGMFNLSTEQKESLTKFAEAYHKAKCEQAEPATIVTQIDAVKFQEALDAMCVDKDAKIAELKAQVALDESLMAESTRTIQELEAHINILREALKGEQNKIKLFKITGDIE